MSLRMLRLCQKGNATHIRRILKVMLQLPKNASESGLR